MKINAVVGWIRFLVSGVGVNGYLSMQPSRTQKACPGECSLDTFFVSGVGVYGDLSMQQPRTQKACPGYIFTVR